MCCIVFVRLLLCVHIACRPRRLHVSGPSSVTQQPVVTFLRVNEQLLTRFLCAAAVVNGHVAMKLHTHDGLSSR